MKKINLFLLIAWMIVIFLFSHQPADVSTKTSQGVTKTVVTIVENVAGYQVDQNQMESILDKSFVLVRKSAHFLEYLILGILMIHMWKDYHNFDRRLFLLAILSCIFYACTDEIHQLFISGRSGQVMDVLIDSTGSVIGILCYGMVHRKKIRRNEI